MFLTLFFFRPEGERISSRSWGLLALTVWNGVGEMSSHAVGAVCVPFAPLVLTEDKRNPDAPG